jgi:prepilin-type N-terminal cleavage/methylation domain-containing protein
MLTTVNLNNKGLTLVEVLIASVITLVLFMALMQTALLSIDMNTGNDMRNEAIRITDERKAVMKGNIIDSDDFGALDSDTDPELDGADCPQEFFDDFDTTGVLIERNIRNIQDFQFCTNLTCVEPAGAGGSDGDCATPDNIDIKQVNFTVGWIWKGEDYMHSATTIVRRP